MAAQILYIESSRFFPTIRLHGTSSFPGETVSQFVITLSLIGQCQPPHLDWKLSGEHACPFAHSCIPPSSQSLHAVGVQCLCVKGWMEASQGSRLSHGTEGLGRGAHPRGSLWRLLGSVSRPGCQSQVIHPPKRQWEIGLRKSDCAAVCGKALGLLDQRSDLIKTEF